MFDLNKLLNLFRTPLCSVTQHLIGESVQDRVNSKIIKRRIFYCQALYFLDCLLIYDQMSTINYFSMKYMQTYQYTFMRNPRLSEKRAETSGYRICLVWILDFFISKAILFISTYSAINDQKI